VREPWFLARGLLVQKHCGAVSGPVMVPATIGDWPCYWCPCADDPANTTAFHRVDGAALDDEVWARFDVLTMGYAGRLVDDRRVREAKFRAVVAEVSIVGAELDSVCLHRCPDAHKAGIPLVANGSHLHEGGQRDDD
jgi:hypothetical protein